MKNNIHSTYMLIVSIGIAFLCTLIVPSASAAFRYLQEGMTAPVVSGQDMSSGTEISSEPRGHDRVVVVTFWASWSQRSLQVLADAKSIKKQYADLPLRIIAVNVDNQKTTPELREEIGRTIADLNLPFPVILDNGLAAYDEYGVIAVPSTAVLDSLGTVRYAPSGYSLTVHDRLIDTIEVLLGVKEPTEKATIAPAYQPTPRASRFYRLAVQLTTQRMYERALANLELAIAADSNFSAPHNLRGHILLKLDSLAAAAAEFAQAVELDGTSVAAWAGWGRALFRDGQPEQAYEKLTAALTRDGSYTPALLDLALCLAEQQATGEALDSLRAARDLNPRDPTVYYYLGRVQRETDQFVGAVEAFRTAVELLFPAP